MLRSILLTLGLTVLLAIPALSQQTGPIANPNTTVTGGGFGTITSAVSAGGDPRIIQFGLKVVF